jgi:hypothetical protein
VEIMGEHYRRALHRVYGTDYDELVFTLLIAALFVSAVFLLPVF